MNKEDLIKYGLISFGLVLAGRFFANGLFAWIEGLFVRKGADEKSLDDMIRAKRYSMGGLSEKEAVKVPSKKPNPQIEQTVDPVELQKRELMHRIYSLDLKRGPQESPEAHALRILGLTQMEPLEQIKRAFKRKARDFHPDMFVLNDFDKRTKKRLDGRIHENYVAIQKAYDFLKARAQ